MTNSDLLYSGGRVRFSLKNATHQMSLIRMRVNINGDRVVYYLPSDYKICPKHWDKINGMAIESARNNPDLKGSPRLQLIMRNINKEVDRTANTVIKILEEYKIRDIYPTAGLLRDDLKRELNRDQKKKLKFTDFCTFMEYYISLCNSGAILNSNGCKLVAGSIRSYTSTLSALKRYCNNKRKSLSLECITLSFYHDFVRFLNGISHSRGKYKPNVIGKFIKSIKVVMRYAYENGYTTNDEFKRREFKVHKECVETIYLTETELESLYSLQLPENKAQIRDCFIIACYTGLRYSDIARLEEKHIDFERRLITIVTQKTNTLAVIPMNKKVDDIIHKNGNKPPKVQCNQSTNRVLKQLCRQAGITTFVSVMETKGGIKRESTYEKCDMVTSHTARRSFATNAYRAGIPSLAIMQITGHRTESSFMRYIRVTKEENALALQSHSFFIN